MSEKQIPYYVSVTENIKYGSYCKDIADSFKLNPWEKGDFDGNGLTDIIITGNTRESPGTICILDKGNEFETKKISKGNLYEICAFANVKDNKIEYKSIKLQKYNTDNPLETDLLVYKFGEFIEENVQPKRHHILEIEFRATGCYGRCPSFTLNIVSNRNIEWTADQYNDIGFRDYSGEYESKLSENQFKELIEVLNYTDFENLNEEYDVAYTDSTTGYLKITYDDMKVKTIRDYGMMGTRALRKLYDILFGLRGTVEWRKQ
ncbi:DUF6438 domain-containing protein [Chryseobacterium antibioticum]|uniref:DUF6438 domain-containing protein n=1 Tax=Chryseobacterium pyrolae TaxID=2987481 RepID=A0ABT2IJZ2_9FLAO|nr:DUF6438 domain-containing protein [Chryseobacterium pyrolae]MCT2408683.1 DUF6438 domain-containing protein [Chryseobacterium pyrolae]